MSDRDDLGAFVIGFVVGGLAGAVAALLLAPTSGEETRAVIKEKAIELKDRTSESVGQAYSQAETAARDALTRAQDLFHQAEARAEQAAAVLMEDKPKGRKIAGKADETPAA